MNHTLKCSLGLALLVATACAPAVKRRSMENEGLWVEVGFDASVRVMDKMSGVDWTLGSPRIVKKDGTSIPVEAAPQLARSRNKLSYAAPDGTVFRLRLQNNPPSIEYSFEPAPDAGEVFLLDRGLPVTGRKDNYYAVPKELGVLIPVEGEKSYTRRLKTYWWGQLSMAMCGAVNHGSAMLVWWDDAYTDLVIRYSAPEKATVSEQEQPARLSMGVALRQSARRVHLRPLGKAGYVEIAKAYRSIAKQRGFLKTLREKVSENPKVERFFGAADFKPFVLMRRAPHTRWNQTGKEQVNLSFTFAESAQLAEHFRNDLAIDRALLVLAGWINGGYDNRHPDILPAAPELGSNEGLAACSRRVKALGYLFGLHDNYQDMYRDAPSWDESYIMKNEDGSLVKGGVWAGGQCWLICSRKSLELASRPRNVPGVVKICAPDVYFSDTIFASPPRECYDPDHPLTLNDDVASKQKLCDYMRGQAGLFGSEDGREWGVPHADYFEGLLSHKTGYRDRDRGDIVIPLFEMVFGDCIPIYTHQSDRPRPDEPKKILDHILYAEMPVYYFGKHTYWKDPSQDYKPKPVSEKKLLYAQGGQFSLTDQFIKNTYEVLSPLNRVTALIPMTGHEFLTLDRQVEKTRFGDDVEIVVNYGEAEFTVSDVTLPRYGFLVTSPTLMAYCALRYHDLNYAEPTMFVLRSLDGKPLASSAKIRIYRAFGSRRVVWNGEVYEVDSERIVSTTE